MKNFKKGFTLVEMLIVVVIIGILSAALLPRLQGAQSSARDAARRSDLNQLGSAILSYYNNRWAYPWSWNNYSWAIPASAIQEELMSVVELSSLPTDPNKNNLIQFDKNNWLWKDSDNIGSWQYGYFVVTKNTIPKGWYILIARTETEWGSNYLQTMASSWDLKDFKTCTSFGEVGKWQCSSQKTATTDPSALNWLCCYENKWQLRYVYVF